MVTIAMKETPAFLAGPPVCFLCKVNLETTINRTHAVYVLSAFAIQSWYRQ
jgi:hypothetical protein